MTPPLTTTTTYRPRPTPPTPLTPPASTTPAASPTRATPTATSTRTDDGFARTTTTRERPSSSRDAASTPAADPALASELLARRASAGDGREVRTPIVGQARGAGGASGAGTTMRGSLPDALATSAARPATPGAEAFRAFETQSAGDIQTVRTNLQTARDQMRTGDYAAAAANLRDLRENHSMGFLCNGNLGTTGMNSAQALERQATVCADMERRLGRDVACPPSEAETRAYFRTFDSPTARPAAQDAFRDYTRAFYTHTQTALDPSSDVRYSADRTQLVHGGRIYAETDRAAPADAVRAVTHTPDTWADVTSRRQTAGLAAGDGSHAGRRVIDCEGYSYLSDTLMREAGYRVEHIAVGRPDGAATPRDLHAMTELTDPSSGARVVQSNDQFYSDAYTGYRRAVTLGSFETPAYFRAATMRDAQTLAVDPAAPR